MGAVRLAAAADEDRFGSDSSKTTTNSTVQALSPEHRASFELKLTQPLLKGLGSTVTNAPIHIAQINEEIADEAFRDTIINELANAINTYWDLVFTINNYEVRLLSLERAQELLRIAVIKRDTSVEPPNVVLQAQAEVSGREASVIAAQRAIADAGDSLKRVMNITEDDAQVRPAKGALQEGRQAVRLRELQRAYGATQCLVRRRDELRGDVHGARVYALAHGQRRDRGVTLHDQRRANRRRQIVTNQLIIYCN